MAKKIRVGVLFGGKSAEHEVSLLSARSVIQSLDPNKYDVFLIGIHKTGEWRLHANLDTCLLNPTNPKQIALKDNQEPVALVAKETGNPLVRLSEPSGLKPHSLSLEEPLDVIFPVLHGPNGEDGTVQGLCKLANMPFVGAGVLGSAVGMDKDVMKRLLKEAGIPIAKFLVFRNIKDKNLNFEYVSKQLGVPFFVKPANLGSSIGISKVKNSEEFMEKIKYAFQFDHKILIEEFIFGREMNCAVLGNEDPVASLPCEIIPKKEFHSYESKYINEEKAEFIIPAKITEQELAAIQKISLETYQVLCSDGMARVDLFLKDNGQVIVNEINTIPGFTQLSPYPKMWDVTGLPYPKLLDKLIDLALERFEKEKQLKTSIVSIST